MSWYYREIRLIGWANSKLSLFSNEWLFYCTCKRAWGELQKEWVVERGNWPRKWNWQQACCTVEAMKWTSGPKVGCIAWGRGLWSVEYWTTTLAVDSRMDDGKGHDPEPRTHASPTPRGVRFRPPEVVFTLERWLKEGWGKVEWRAIFRLLQSRVVRYTVWPASSIYPSEGVWSIAAESSSLKRSGVPRISAGPSLDNLRNLISYLSWLAHTSYLTLVHLVLYTKTRFTSKCIHSPPSWQWLLSLPHRAFRLRFLTRPSLWVRPTCLLKTWTGPPV